MTKIKVPRLRFSGFSGEWKETKMEDVSDIRDGTHSSPKKQKDGYSLITSKNLKDGHIDFLNVSKISKIDYETINKRSKVDKNDIIFGMIGTIGNPVLIKKGGFAIKNVALIKGNKWVNPNFMLNFLLSIPFENQITMNNEGGTQKFISLKNIRNCIINITEYNEQQKIGDFFAKQDKLIELQTQKVDQLKKLKRGYLQKMFPQEGETVPRLRFSGFSGEWKEEKLDSLLLECNNRKVKNVENYKLLKVRLHFKGVKATTDHPRVTSKGRKYFLRKPGDLIIGKQNFHNGGFAIIPDNVEGYVASSAIVSFTNKSNCNLNFVNFYMMNNDWLRRTTIFIGGTGQKEYSVKTLKSLKIKIPTLEEQEKISKFFKVIDNKIAYEKDKLNTLNKLKKAYLQKMFV